MAPFAPPGYAYDTNTVGTIGQTGKSFFPSSPRLTETF